MTEMNEWALDALVTAEDVLEREFGERLRESSSLAFRVAYGVLRQREDAIDDHCAGTRELIRRTECASHERRDLEGFEIVVADLSDTDVI